MCGAIQLSVDIIIILQIMAYKKMDIKLYDPVSTLQANDPMSLSEQVSHKWQWF